MSKWTEVTDPKRIDFSDDKKFVHIWFDTDEDGNCYIEVPLAVLEQALGAALRETAERRLGMLREMNKMHSVCDFCVHWNNDHAKDCALVEELADA